MMFHIASWHPDQRLVDTLHAAPAGQSTTAHYLYADEQKRVVAAMALNVDFILAQAIRGTPSKVIAAGHGVSREAIDVRLRAIGLKNPPGVRGRPKTLQVAS